MNATFALLAVAALAARKSSAQSDTDLANLVLAGLLIRLIPSSSKGN